MRLNSCAGRGKMGIHGLALPVRSGSNTGPLMDPPRRASLGQNVGRGIQDGRSRNTKAVKHSCQIRRFGGSTEILGTSAWCSRRGKMAQCEYGGITTAAKQSCFPIRSIASDVLPHRVWPSQALNLYRCDALTACAAWEYVQRRGIAGVL